jgi:hypothetical protein
MRRRIRSFGIALILATCGIAVASVSQEAQTTKLVFGREVGETFELPSVEVQDAEDICFDPETRHILILAPRSAKRHVLREFNLKGHLENEWNLPQLTPITGIWAVGNRYRLVMGEGEDGYGGFRRTAAVTLPTRPGPVDERFTAERWSTEHDDALDRRTAGDIRDIMAQVRYYPAMREQGGPPPPGSERYVFINARPLGNDIVEWSANREMIFFSWTTLTQATVAVKAQDGRYKTYPVEKTLEAGVSDNMSGQRYPSITSAKIYSDLAFVGMWFYDVKTTTHAGPVVVWLDLARNKPSVKRVTPGRLVRTIHRL